jgi:predicted DNA-binding transcriptional regulator AlpA
MAVFNNQRIAKDKAVTMEDNLLFSILAELRRINNHSRLWSIEDIEHYFQMGRTSVTKKIISNKDFPKPISINKTLPRWKPEEVKQWAEKQRN